MGGSNDTIQLWKYVGKFAWAIGTGTYKVTWRLKEPRPEHESLNLKMLLYLDETWDAVSSHPQCGQTAETAYRRKFDIALPSDGAWAKSLAGNIKHSVRSHIWYFVISACDTHLKEPVTLDFEFSAWQDGGSQFSVEQQYLLPVHSVVLVFSTLLVIYYVKMCRQTLHPVMWTLSFVIALQYVAQVCHAVHLYLFMKDGRGAPLLETSSEFFFMWSQVTQSALLILIAWGYCFSTTRSNRMEYMIPLVAALWIVHAGVLAMGKSRDGAHDKHCEHEGLVGWCLVLLRILLFAWFSSAVEELQRHATRRNSDFLQTFKKAGAAYFATYPVLFFIVQFVAPYLRHTFMQTSLMIFQLLSDVWLSSLFFSRGAFYQMSVWSGSQLPGGSSRQDWLPKDS